MKSEIKRAYREIGEVTNEEMKKACQCNLNINILFEEAVRILKDIKTLIASELAKFLTAYISFYIGLSTNSRNKPVIFPSINSFLNAFEMKSE